MAAGERAVTCGKGYAPYRTSRVPLVNRTRVRLLCYNRIVTRGASALPGPTVRTLIRIGMRTRGGGRMRFSEFLKYLIVLLLLAIVLVAVSRQWRKRLQPPGQAAAVSALIAAHCKLATGGLPTDRSRVNCIVARSASAVGVLHAVWGSVKNRAQHSGIKIISLFVANSSLIR